MSGLRKLGKSKAKAALALVNPTNAVLPADAETRISALESVDHWHTNLTALDKVRGFGGFTFFSDGRGLSFIQKTSNYTITTNDSGIVCDVSAGGITLTLPNTSACFDATNLASIIYDVHKVDSSTNTVTVVPSSTETIAGESKIVLSRPNETIQLATDGTNWLVRNRDRIYEGTRQTFKNNSVTISDTTVANTVAETTIFTTSFGADELRAADMIETILNGIYSTNNGTDTFTLRVKINGTAIHTLVSEGKSVTNTPVEMMNRITVRTDGASGTLTSFLKIDAFKDVIFASDSVDTSINTTIANTLTVTMQWGVASVNNSGTIKQSICKING